jgi:hypothetical protein
MKVTDVENPDDSTVSLKNIENNDKIITKEETSKVNEKTLDDSISISSDSDNTQNDTSVNSSLDNDKLNSPSSKNITSKKMLKKQESAKKQKERLRIKLVS